MANVNNCRRIPLSDTLNFRDFGGYPTVDGKVTQYGVFFRSACPNGLNIADKALLKSLNITTAVDLRGECGGAMQTGFITDGINVYHFSVGGDNPPNRVEDCAQGYLNIAESADIVGVFKTLANNTGAAVFHCSAGKDRTGVVAALLLSLASVADEDIIADYILSYAYYLTKLRQYFLCAEVPCDVLKPLPEHMEGFLKLLRAKYGTTQNYMLRLGVLDADIQKLKCKLTK